MIEPDDDPRSPCGLHLFVGPRVPRRCPLCAAVLADRDPVSFGRTWGGRERTRAPRKGPKRVATTSARRRHNEKVSGPGRGPIPSVENA